MSSASEDAQALLELGLEELDPELVSEALRQGANPNDLGCDSSDFSHPPLYWAVWSGNAELVRTLLNGGAKVECEIGRHSTSVHLAAEKGYFEILELLFAVDGKLALNAFDLVDRTPLMCAVDRADPQVIELLIQAGSDVNARNAAGGGGTALLRAAQEGSVEIVKLLLRAGADPRIPGFMGLTPFDKAEERRPEVRDELLELFRHPEKTRHKPVSHRKARRSHLAQPD